MKHTGGGKIAILIVYVDDIIILTRSDEAKIARLKKCLAAEFETKDLGTLQYFLGMEIAKSKKGVVVTQRKYVVDLLEETTMSGCRPSDTLMDPNKLRELTKGVPIEIGRYQWLVGKLIYLSHTRPDIAFTVSVMNQFMHSPYEKHLETVYRILRYLKSTPRMRSMFKKSDKRSVEVFIDANQAGSITDRRSTSGYCAFLWVNLVTWRSKEQNMVAQSSAEVEFKYMENGVCEILWLKRVLEKLKLNLEPLMKLFNDNKVVISIANNPVQHDRTKHVKIDRHFIKEKLESDVICMPFVTIGKQIADASINIYTPT